MHISRTLQLNYLKKIWNTRSTVYIDRLKIENLKCFAKSHVDLNHPRKKYVSDTDAPKLKNVNLFVGENGTGKTTVCQAVCISVLKNILGTSAGGFRSEGLVRMGEKVADIFANLDLAVQDGGRGKPEAHATIKKVSGTEILETRGQPAGWAKALLEEESPTVFLAAYGASRRTERPEGYNERLRNLRYQRTASIFESYVGLIPLSLAFAYSRARMAELIELVNRLLPELPTKVQLTKDNVPTQQRLFTEPLFSADDVLLPLSGLSDGYRLYIGWVVDLISHIARVISPDMGLSEIEGVVIIDEIDLFLHPEWQRHVVHTLAQTFPNIQFLLTTHSPIVAGTLESQNIFSIDRVGPHTCEILPCTEDVYGVSIDKILVRLFGLESPRAPELEMQLAELEAKARQGDQDASIEYLRRLRLGVAKK